MWRELERQVITVDDRCLCQNNTNWLDSIKILYYLVTLKQKKPFLESAPKRQDAVESNKTK